LKLLILKDVTYDVLLALSLNQPTIVRIL